MELNFQTLLENGKEIIPTWLQMSADLVNYTRFILISKTTIQVCVFLLNVILLIQDETKLKKVKTAL